MNHPNLTRAAQGIAAVVLAMAAVMKFLDDAESVHLFTTLDMEPVGRYLVATLELLSALLLISPFAAVGSLIAFSVMLGATIAHLTHLGVVVGDDGGRMFAMLLVVLCSSGYVLISRRKELPLVGQTL